MMLRRIFHTPLALLVRRIALLYAVLLLCRGVFLLGNLRLLWPIDGSEWGTLLRGALLFDTASILYANALFILLSLLPLHLREKGWWQRTMQVYYLTVNFLLLVVVNLADVVYFRYTQKRFTADEIFFADNANSLQLIGKFAAENWYLLFVGAALFALLFYGYGRRIRPQNLWRSGWAYYGFGTLILAVAAGLSVAGMRGGMTRMTRPITLSNAMLYTPDSNRANLILSNPFCILRTAGESSQVKYKRFFTEPELSALYTPRHEPADSAAIDLKGRNVMIFIMESMSAEHSAYLMPELYADRDTKGFTPFLDSLMRNGLTFKQMYANGTRSIQALPSVLGSIPSFKTPFVLMPQSLCESRQLPAILADRGYATTFFCGSERGSMGFGAYARSTGIDRLVSREDYEARHGKGGFDGYWGIWDEEFLQFTGEELSQTQQPFFASLFTLSSHHPFVVPERYAQSLPEGYTKIHKGVAYDDQAFRRFFEQYGHEEWFQHTIFVFVADHVSSERMDAQTNVYPGNRHIIGFLYTTDGALRGEIDEVAQQIDLMPTLLGMLGNREPYFAFGRDVLNEPDRPSWSVSYEGRFQAVDNNAEYYFDDNSSEVTPRNADSIAPAKADSVLNRFRALVQQYYTHIEQKNYTVK